MLRKRRRSFLFGASNPKRPKVKSPIAKKPEKTTKKFDKVIIWNLEWVYDNKPPKMPPFGEDIHRYFIIEAAFVDHEGRELCNTPVDATIDNIFENKFTEKHGFHEKVKNRKTYPKIEIVWKDLTEKLEGDVLFISFGGKIGAELPIDYEVLNDVVDVKDYCFRDAYNIIPDEYCKHWENGFRKTKKLGRIYRELFSKELERSHTAIGDALGLQEILNKLGLLQQFLKSS